MINNRIDTFEVVLQTYDGLEINITDNVTDLQIYENINSYFLEGTISIIDNSGILSSTPIIGNERIAIVLTKDDEATLKSFRVAKLTGAKRINEFTGGFVLHLVSESAYLNNQISFSRHFKGLNSAIVKAICKDYLEIDLNVVSKGGYNANIVFPYIRPYAAINKILKSTYSDDASPLFMFESLWSDEVKLISMYDMLHNTEEAEIPILNNTLIDNPETDAIESYNKERQVRSFAINESYNTLRLMSEGVFANTTIDVDVSTKKIEYWYWDMKKNIKPIEGQESWVVNDLNLENRGMYNTSIKNSMSYDSNDLPTLTSTNELEMAKMKAYKRLAGSVVGDIVVDNDVHITAGSKIMTTFPKFAPELDETAAGSHLFDHINSGEFLVSAVNHHINREGARLSYKMSIEVIRDGIGK